MNRDSLFKISRILNYVTAGLMLLTLVSFALPYFNYSGGDRDVISLWVYLGFPQQFEQMEDLLSVKFVTIKQLNVVLGMIIFGILSMIVLLRKKGIGAQFLPLVYSVWGTIGFFANNFLKLGNTFARPLDTILVILTLACVVANIVVCIIEIKTRDEEDFMDLDAWSTAPAGK